METIIRINKNEVDRLSSKCLCYYWEKTEDSNDIAFIDNRKGKKIITEFSTIKELEKHIKELK